MGRPRRRGRPDLFVVVVDCRAAMSDMIRKIAFLLPKPGLSLPAFTAYWRRTHGPLVANSPGYAAWRSQYAQNHVLGLGPIGAPPAFAGMAAFRLPSAAPNEDDYATTPIYLDRIRIDELNFIDMDRTVSMSAIEHPLKRGTGAAKIVILSTRAAALSSEDFASDLCTRHRDAVLALPAAQLLRGWSANVVIPGTFRLPGARAVQALKMDCVEEFWFDTSDDASAFFAALASSDEVRAVASGLIDTRSLISFQAEELVFFDDGRPTALAMQSSPAS